MNSESRKKAKPSRSDTPTHEQIGACQKAYDYFNGTLFDGTLPDVMENFSRKSRAKGFYSSESWYKGEHCIPEISLNPDMLARPTIEVMSTLVHEMVHHWQYTYGKPSRRGYHNREWAQMMELIGLMPSSTGEPGGKRTGFRVTHYLIKGGRFFNVFSQMPEDCLMPWIHLPKKIDNRKVNSKVRKTGESNSRVKSKFTCPLCQANAWGKPSSNLICGRCYEVGGDIVRMSNQDIV
ncbi:MAG: SprT-like domain-containing protein [Cyanobacteria bacterium P01_D01_bin.156]